MNNKFYIFDKTINPVKYQLFDTVDQLVSYLEGLVVRAFGKTRDQFMFDMSSLGHGYDDPAGVTFTRLISEHVNIGMLKNGVPTKCDVHMVQFDKEEFGT